ncbi:hypothetical protein A3A64_01770 [Candidatus Gottesmanbacteria bacterium RIFCSPLOWO2_01_FULL_48_11]|uniref:Small ribosomal subunit protein bS20 n=3 Tax=Candidatus Gottesmaniibacteriota TaxID=1752720 RepID=A0A0G1UQB9_9BACT|nr:MAG: 30S ribosomal protein S20 [Candidatus Gottesmanbacteria bacterium GW2011_GWA2_47_9]KKU96261.1 MAG: 30S ribosomal protein S20 [Candidatus Gottesmanbacteria bacterium GW2011_GWA1_48_13]OGG27515.1 MAG: hypothetical protein A3A64_01770 [Candidatus Gottesmanbacteria bacterium RIFCSPLOWO2_01_FULL_48_11]
MPIIKSAAKKLRRDARVTKRTERVKTTLKKLVKAARKTPSQKTLTAVFSALDKAAKHNVIHKNKAARLKSRLSKLLKKK